MEAEYVVLAAILVGAFLASIPLIGLTLRFAITPAVDSIVRALAASRGQLGSPEIHGRLEQLESQLAEIQQTLSHLAEVKAFDRELSASTAPPRRSLPG